MTTLKITAMAATAFLAGTSAFAQTATTGTDADMPVTEEAAPLTTPTEPAIDSMAPMTANTDTAMGDDMGMAPFSTTGIDAGGYLASDLIGMRLYVTETEMDVTTPVVAGSAVEWDDVGEIGDLLVSSDGSLEAVLLDIGGFLGIGERQVAVDWSALRPVVEDDDPDEVFLTINSTQEALENAPEFDATVRTR